MEHDYAVDVWGLGQVALKLLDFVSCYQGHPLRTLAVSMIEEVPDERPSIDQVCTSMKKVIKTL